MNVIRFILAALLALGLMPWIAQASDADTFVAASRTQQAQLLERWAAAPEPQRLPLLTALSKENVFTDGAKRPFSQFGGRNIALGAAQTPAGALKKLRLTNRLRSLVAGALAAHQLLSDSVTERRMAASALQRNAQPAMLPYIRERLAQETDSRTQSLLGGVLANLQLTNPVAE